MKRFANLTLLAVFGLSLSAISNNTAHGQDLMNEYGPAIRYAVAGANSARGGTTWEIQIAGRGDVPTDANGEFWFMDLHPNAGTAAAYFLKIKDIDGESTESPAAGQDGSDLLIVNNGDGSDFMKHGLPAIDDLAPAMPPASILIGLLLPAVQKVREAASRSRD